MVYDFFYPEELERVIGRDNDRGWTGAFHTSARAKEAGKIPNSSQPYLTRFRNGRNVVRDDSASSRARIMAQLGSWDEFLAYIIARAKQH